MKEQLSLIKYFYKGISNLTSETKKVQFSYFLLAVALTLLINLILLKLFYLLFNPSPIRLQAIDYSAYSSVIVAMLSNKILIILWIVAIAIPSILAVKFPKLFSWHQFHQYDKWIVNFAIFIITWVLITSATNYYFGYERTLDRLFLAVLAFATWRHPAFIPAFCILAFSLFNELNFPLSNFWISEKGAILDLLILALAFVTTRLVLPQAPSSIFLFLAVIIHIQNYFWAGVQKIVITKSVPWGWLTENDPSLLIIQSILDGFANFVPLETLISLASIFRDWQLPLNIAVLSLELLGCIAFFNTRAIQIYLVLCSLLNTFIFITTGIFFYEWLLLGFLLAYIVWQRRTAFENTQLYGALAFILLLSANYWHHPHRLGWFDAPVVNVIEFHARLTDGTTVSINDNSFEPYDRIFNYDNDFLFFTNRPIKTSADFTSLTDLQFFRNNIVDSKQFIKWQDKTGNVKYNATLIHNTEIFIRRFISNKFKGNTHFFRKVLPDAPLHLHRYKREPSLVSSSSKVDEVLIKHIQWVIIEGKPILIFDEIVHTIPIAQKLSYYFIDHNSTNIIFNN